MQDELYEGFLLDGEEEEVVDPGLDEEEDEDEEEKPADDLDADI